MARLPQFSLRYLLAMMFWWSLAFVIFYEVFREDELFAPWQATRASYHVLLFPIAFCPAVGGLFLKMRAGFYVGFLASAAIWVVVICAERFS